jgi:Protein of unknown function (DUF2939)
MNTGEPLEDRIRREIQSAVVGTDVPNSRAASPPAASRWSRKKRRLLGVAVAVLAVVAAGYAYASPYLTVSRVRAAAERGDAATVNAHVDFPAMRESMKGWMGVAMAKQLAKQGNDVRSNPFNALGAAFAMTLVEKMVDALVTPEMVSAMLEGRRPGQRSKPDARAGTEAPLMGYEGFDRFVVTMRRAGEPREEFSMIWRRSGLTWKLSAVRLPPPE